MRFLAFLLAATLAVAADAPKLEFDLMEFDFGGASEGDELAGKFAFRNTGNAVLNIDTPETSCGCTVASVKPTSVKPGESGEIDFKLDLTNVRGSVKKTISVPSNDPEQPMVTLIISGEVKAVFEIEPQMVFFGDVLPGELSSAIVHVRRLDGKKLAIARAEGTRDFLKVSVEPVSASEARLLVEAKGTGKPEQFTDILDVTLEGAAKPAFHLPLAGQFLASIKVEPAMLAWNVSAEDTGAVHTLRISATLTNQPLMVDNFASTAEDLMVKVVEIKPRQVYEVTLKMARPPAESAREWLTFETNLPDRPTVAIPLRITVAEPATNSLPDALDQP